MTKPNYNCSQQELYTVAQTGWQSCTQHIAAFTAFSPFYNQAYADTQQKAVKDAANLPDEQARTAQSEVFRVELSQLATINLANWQKLKRYITKAYTHDFQKIRLDEAGQSYYEKASHEDWESCKGLLSNGNAFIANNNAALIANQNMPPAFQATFLADSDAFTEKHKEFIDSEETSRIATEDKLNANNGCYNKLMEMFLDGQEIFKDEDAIKKQFIFDQVLNLASGTGTAGIRGTITDAATNAPIPNATINIESINKSTTTDEEGKYIITQVASGKYKVIFTAQLYQQKSILQEIKVGTISTANQQLAKI